MASVKDILKSAESHVQKLFHKGQKEEEKEHKLGEEEEKESQPKVKTNDEEMLNAVLKKINEMVDEFTERLTQVEHKVNDLEAHQKDNTENDKLKEEIKKIHTTLDEFSKFYELVCRQYDPFTKEKGVASSAEVEAQQPTQQISKEQNNTSPDLLEQANTLFNKAEESLKRKDNASAKGAYKEIMSLYKACHDDHKVEIYDKAIQLSKDIKAMS